MPNGSYAIDWSAIAQQGIFAILFVYLFLDTRNENRKRETIMRESFTTRETKFLDLEQKFIDGLHENSMVISRLSELIATKLDEMKERIEAADRYPVHTPRVK